MAFWLSRTFASPFFLPLFEPKSVTQPPSDKALAGFLESGWSGSAQGDAAAKAGEKGGAYSGPAEVAPGVWVYQSNKDGLALQLTPQGTKYYKDDKLNRAKPAAGS